jgi:hypothetical protein
MEWQTDERVVRVPAGEKTLDANRSIVFAAVQRVDVQCRVSVRQVLQR